jgi:hypothetical protein
MYTSLVFFALVGSFAPSATPDGPQWLRDYATARKQARTEKKPLAVVVGSGKTGWEKLSREGRLGKEVNNLLAENYVCVYVDAGQKAGERLASALELEDGLGIVLSDRTGELQAFRHEGDLANGDLARYLRRYADPDRVVDSTDSNPGSEQPAAVSQPVYAPAGGYRSFYPMGGGFRSFGGGGRGGC